MADRPPIAYATRLQEPPALEIRVNFGVYTGRDATPQEIRELGAALVKAVGDVSIVSEERHEIGESASAALYRVRIEISGDSLPDSEEQVAELSERLVTAAEIWTRSCFRRAHAEVAE